MAAQRLCVPILVTLAFVALSNLVNSQILCTYESLVAQVNYTDPFIWDVINNISSNPNTRLPVSGSPWTVSADFTYVESYYHDDVHYQARMYKETAIYGGNNIHSNNTLYTVIVAGNPLYIYDAQVFVQDSYGNCIVNGVPYNQPFISNDPGDAYPCDYIDIDGDDSADGIDCYSWANDPAEDFDDSSSNKKSKLRNNLPSVWRTRDAKFSIENLPYCTPLYEVIHYANHTSAMYRSMSHIFFNVVFQDYIPDAITISSTCSNFPAADSYYDDYSPNSFGNAHKIPSRIRPRTPLSHKANMHHHHTF